MEIAHEGIRESSMEASMNQSRWWMAAKNLGIPLELKFGVPNDQYNCNQGNKGPEPFHTAALRRHGGDPSFDAPEKLGFDSVSGTIEVRAPGVFWKGAGGYMLAF
jgi:hypothetical protein